jgi:hypothetical protein
VSRQGWYVGGLGGNKRKPQRSVGVQRIARQGPGTVRHPVEISRPTVPIATVRRRLAATKDAVVGKEKPRPERVLTGASPGNLACDGGPPLHEHFTPSNARESTAPLVRYGRPRSSHPLRERRRWPPGAVLHSLSGFKCLLRVRPKTSKSVRRTKLSSLRRGRQEKVLRGLSGVFRVVPVPPFGDRRTRRRLLAPGRCDRHSRARRHHRASRCVLCEMHPSSAAYMSWPANRISCAT